MDIYWSRKHPCNLILGLCNYLWLCISVPTISVKLPRIGGAPVLRSVRSLRYFCLLLITWQQHKMSILPLTGTILSASLLVGFTTTLILFCSHFHQVEEDKAVGKFSPLVRLGTERGSGVVKVAVATLYSLLFAFSVLSPYLKRGRFSWRSTSV
uniref:Uncharacterized protein n=1 Tax=Salix viminalis TaxID=40686 RepID=A0A6N2LJK1_SALVM